jgi:hypothetical protein
LQLELDSPFVAAALTVFGYSIHDTVVIFDRIRENSALHRHYPFDSVVNASLLQTMARSINTVLTTLMTLVCLAIFGGNTVKPFAIALIIGICSGAYSSIFNASQLLVTWQRMWEAGAGDKLWWRALLALAPAAALGVIAFSVLPDTPLGPMVSQYGVLGHLGVAAGLYVVALLLTRYFSVGALRVLAGVPASKGGVATRVPTPMKLTGQSAAVQAAVEATRGMGAQTQMEAASQAAAEERREERRVRREQRKTKEGRRAGERKKRF